MRLRTGLLTLTLNLTLMRTHTLGSIELHAMILGPIGVKTVFELKPPKDVRKSMSGRPTRGTFLLEASLVAKMQVVHVLEHK